MFCIVRGGQKGQLGMHITTRQVCIGQEEDRGSFMCCHFTRESQVFFLSRLPMPKSRFYFNESCNESCNDC